jgi:hypothetical protein
VLLIRRIRELLYDEGFTISGARNRLLESGVPSRAAGRLAVAAAVAAPGELDAEPAEPGSAAPPGQAVQVGSSDASSLEVMLEHVPGRDLAALRTALLGIRDLLDV